MTGAWMLWMAGSLAVAGVHETGLGIGVARHDGPRQVLMGAGPRLVHRYAASHQTPWFVQGGLERLWLMVPTWGLSAGAGVRRSERAWTPAALIEVAAYPSRIRKLNAEHPEPPWFPATSVRLRLAPLAFQVSATSRVSALELAPGLGLDTPRETLAFSVSVCSLTHRW